jgi:hypothetical protein
VRTLVVTLLVTAVAVLAAVGSTAAAPRPFDAGQRLCTAQGGVWDTFGYGYNCFNFDPTVDPAFSEGELAAARQVCERLYGGVFFFFSFYSCTVRPV